VKGEEWRGVERSGEEWSRGAQAIEQVRVKHTPYTVSVSLSVSLSLLVKYVL
jgi:hypothetical protein